MEKHIFKKKFGQNFLQDENILLEIINSIDVSKDDLIIEIGAGAGALTKKLKKLGCNVLAYEIDTSLEKSLRDLEDDKLKVVFKDFMTSNIKDDISNYNYKNLYLVANLPYYITTPILEKVIESGLDFQEIVIMVQDEVAKRLTGKSGTKDFGAFTVLLDCFYEREYLFYVDRKAFYPSPNVDSAVLKLINKNINYNYDYKKFKKFIFDAFQFKRKNLKNNLKNYDLEKINIILKKYGYDLTCRAEEIETEIFIEIYKEINER